MLLLVGGQIIVCVHFHYIFRDTQVLQEVLVFQDWTDATEPEGITD